MPRPTKLVFLDCETTGLDENVHEIIEIAIVAQNKAPLLHTKVRPRNLDEAMTKDPAGTKQALEINGYNELEWRDAPTWVEIAPRVRSLLTDVLIVGHHPGFDLRFINAGFKRTEIGNGGISYYGIDTATLAHGHLIPCGARSVRLGTTCAFLGISNVGAHTALSDALRCREVYYRLLRAGCLRRFWWRLVGPWRLRRAHARR